MGKEKHISFIQHRFVEYLLWVGCYSRPWQNGSHQIRQNPYLQGAYILVEEDRQ